MAVNVIHDATRAIASAKPTEPTSVQIMKEVRIGMGELKGAIIEVIGAAAMVKALKPAKEEPKKEEAKKETETKAEGSENGQA